MTLSVLGFDGADGHLGVASATHGVAVGARVPWARGGVGVAVTQAMTGPSLGRAALDELASGCLHPHEAIQRVLTLDPAVADRQLAVVDAQGRAATHTGGRVPGQTVAQTWPELAVAGNMLAGSGAADAARDAFLPEPRRPLARRLLDALAAGDHVGGDRRGARSAALVVVRSATGEDRPVLDLRVDDHPRPVEELERLLRVHEVQALLNTVYADPEFRDGGLLCAMEDFVATRESDASVAPYLGDLQFWLGVGHIRRGETAMGNRWLERAGRRDPSWHLLATEIIETARLPPSETLERRVDQKSEGDA